MNDDAEARGNATVPVTVVLFAFRQAGLVADAVRGIYAQTVQPAEIILSDDGSPDGTADVLTALAAEYRGPARVVVRRDQPNRGWFAHINACVALARHDWILVCAGDDVSLPQRLGRFWTEAQKAPEVKLWWSLMERMEAGGRRTGRTFGLREYRPGVLRGIGASQFWHRDLFSKLGALPEVQAAEDIVLPFRACLLGGARLIAEPLVAWRDRDYRMLDRRQLDWTYEVRATVFRKNAAQVHAADLAACRALNATAGPEMDAIAARVGRSMRAADAEHRVVTAPTAWGRAALLLRLLPAVGFKRARRIAMDRVLGLPVYLESAYPRGLRRGLPKLSGVLVAIATVWLLPDGWSWWEKAVAGLVALALGISLTRLAMRLAVGTLWRPAA